MKLNRDINIHHLTRVEGHGNIQIKIKDGKLQKAQWEVVETPRFFEAMLVNKHWENAPYIGARICGICSIGHTLASIRSIENTFHLIPSPQISKFRLLLKHMETLQSHILHLYFLAAPDFLNVGSVLPLIKSNPAEVQLALNLKLLANDACDLIGGRTIHPIRTVVGGFTMLPKKSELQDLRVRFDAATVDLLKSVELFRTFNIPNFVRETEFVSLKGVDCYPFIGGDLVSTDGVLKKESDYLTMTNEYCLPGSTAKWAKLSRKSFAVGALARFNNNYQFLNAKAKETAEALGLTPVNHNPFMGNIAQLVECVHVVYDSIKIIDELLDEKWGQPRQKVIASPGQGVGAIEVPRGILYHYFKLDESGHVLKANCVIPTNQNHANIHYDLVELAEQFAADGNSDTDIEKLASMLVRAYDPCISCSVH